MYTQLSIYVSTLLRHAIFQIDVEMDEEGFVDVDALIDGINKNSEYYITREILEEIVKNDDKQRYKFDNDHKRIKACQGHTLSFVKVALKYEQPPRYLYHGTTLEAHEKIKETQAILRMQRHGVHMHASYEQALKSAKRWHKPYCVLKIDALKLVEDGYKVGVTENNVWICEKVMYNYVCEVITKENNNEVRK